MEFRHDAKREPAGLRWWEGWDSPQQGRGKEQPPAPGLLWVGICAPQCLLHVRWQRVPLLQKNCQGTT